MLVAGCGGPPPGPPDPFPPRPEVLDIERLEPCGLLSPQARAVFQVDEGRSGTAQLRGVTTRACGWGSLDTPFDYSVQLIPQDAAQAVGAAGTVLGSVEGYGTVRHTDREETFPLCEILVDVNEGQLLRIQVQTVERRRDNGAAYPIEQVCGQAELAAADAVRSARAATS
ncbi:DUF3558 family protein [Pseudonocardia sp. C8]|nr:DUF3558 family protein [Pseudonocardia sp. C8]MBC3191373.1 DUF3558 family protein [Pseudonocardia sp. C8]